MDVLIYLIMVILYIVLILWVWNNTKDYDDKKERIIFIVLGIIILMIVTFILFSISRIGIQYPSKDVLKQVRKVSLLLFVPLNGFVSLPHIAKLKSDIKCKDISNEEIKKRIIILSCIIMIIIIVQIFYLKDFQSGIIELINRKK